jgi:probable HAF family extracellular repeat protein
MKNKTYFSLAALFSVLLFVSTRAEAQFAYGVTDLGTLGGTTSSANGVAGPGRNAAGMIVGSSTLSDNTEHAFLFVGGQMYDLNTLCDISLSNFKVLTVAKTISDSNRIIGEGITLDGEKHAFLLTPTPVDGGSWSYLCCKWVWKQQGGGWWWDTDCHCYTWHGPPGKHPPPPPQPPHWYWWPIPVPPGCGCQPPLLPPGYCYTCINGHVLVLSEEEAKAQGGQCYGSPEEAIRNCKR